eukprot:scaffold24528_cov120-Isochrysis_galbana.AAC.6
MAMGESEPKRVTACRGWGSLDHSVINIAEAANLRMPFNTHAHVTRRLSALRHQSSAKPAPSPYPASSAKARGCPPFKFRLFGKRKW